MGVAPWRQRRFEAEVFIAYIVPANEAFDPIHHDDLAVITEVDLEARQPAAPGCERLDLHAAVAELVDVTRRQRVAADAVVEHMDRDAFYGFLQQQPLQAATEIIVVDDKKLHEHHLPGAFDGLEDCAKRFIAVDQQLHFVVCQARHASQLRHRA